MRSFIAINLNNSAKDSLMDVIRRLKENNARGNFSRRDNLHITLAFLGEISPARATEAKRVMDSIHSAPFELILSGFGNFSDTYWIGSDKNEALNRMQNALSSELRNSGFSIENREFKPHLTICREAVFENGFDKKAFKESIEPVHMNVDHISLMKSDRLNGRLVYTEIYSTPLGNK
jgi:2'-5' RNA ligase